MTTTRPTTPRTPGSRITAKLALASAGLVGALTVLFTSGIQTEYGTTSGSFTEGAQGGLALAAVPLLVVGVLGTVAVSKARGSRGLRLGAPVLVAAAVLGVLLAGGQAALAKYDGLPSQPDCDVEEFEGSPAQPVAAAAQHAFAELDHPSRFSGGGGAGLDGCDTVLLDIDFADASAHYRGELRDAGWTITRDEPERLEAVRDGLRLDLQDRAPDPPAIAIRPTEPVGLPGTR